MAGYNHSLEEAAVRFDSSKDFTIGIEEEFQILDPESLALTNRFEEMKAAGEKRLGSSIRGELIASEVEICTDKCASIAEAAKDLRDKRRGLFRTAAELGVTLGATGTHPFADWKDQRIINTPHYQRVEELLRYCAWHNTTFGMHVHIGIRGRERIIAIFDAIRSYLPIFLALSANSPFAEGVYTYLHSTRSQLFTKFFPRCGIPGPIGSWDEYTDYMSTLFSTGSVTEPTQVWWSVRPHPYFGTLEIRICDCQSNVEDTLAVSALILAVTAMLAGEYDDGRELPVANTMQVEENFWNAIRFGLDAEMIDFGLRQRIPVKEAIVRLTDRVSTHAKRLGLGEHMERIRQIITVGNGAQRQIRMYQETGDILEVFTQAVSWCQPERHQEERSRLSEQL
ncbi:MAG: YbdK family carboxylate-amine ligase [Gaiellales bacterium]|nr:MAG: YbdK family carboxylate-amine ligase [Gaiellales bacterium]